MAEKILSEEEINEIWLEDSTNRPLARICDSHEALRAERDLLHAEIGRWQRYGAYCRSCAISGEHDVLEFCDFIRCEIPTLSNKEQCVDGH